MESYHVRVLVILACHQVPFNTHAHAHISLFVNDQSYDVEAGLCIFNGMHANAGFLPVIPGPCGLFRAQSLTKELLGQVRVLHIRVRDTPSDEYEGPCAQWYIRTHTDAMPYVNSSIQRDQQDVAIRY